VLIVWIHRLLVKIERIQRLLEKFERKSRISLPLLEFRSPTRRAEVEKGLSEAARQQSSNLAVGRIEH